VNKATTPSYRVFLSDTDGTLTNLSNQQVEGTAAAKLEGSFMGSGSAAAERPSRRIEPARASRNSTSPS